MNRTTRRIAGGAAALGAGAILIGPITALAQSDDEPTTSTPATAPAATGDATDETRPADAPDRTARLTEVLQPLVDAGTITQAQADAVITALQEARPIWGSGHHRGPGMGRGGRISLETAATTIGISAEDLRAALEGGQTLAEVASANGVEPQAVIDALVAAATAKLDEAVAAGDLEQAEADERRAELAERITTAVNEGLPAKGEGGFGPRGHRGDDGTEAADDGTAPGTTEAPTTTEGGS